MTETVQETEQHYFVVAFSNGQWGIDHGTAEARFPEGAVWQSDIEEWRYPDPMKDAFDDDDVIRDLVQRLA
jgi:hypothetical protein